jgi:transposase
LVFIDETWCSTSMARRHGRAPRGQKARAAVPRGHWKTSRFVAGLRADGIVAPFVFDQAMNGATLRQLDGELLAPRLKPGDVVVMDNLAAHKVSGIREAVEAHGAKLMHLLAYSPDLNPLELLFAKLTQLLRSAAARTIDRLWTALGTCLDQFRSAEFQRYLRHCVYGQIR